MGKAKGSLGDVEVQAQLRVVAPKALAHEPATQRATVPHPKPQTPKP